MNTQTFAALRLILLMAALFALGFFADGCVGIDSRYSFGGGT